MAPPVHPYKLFRGGEDPEGADGVPGGRRPDIGAEHLSNVPEKAPRNGTQNRPNEVLVFMQNQLFSLGFCDSGPPGRDPFREHFWIDFWAREARPEKSRQ